MAASESHKVGRLRLLGRAFVLALLAVVGLVMAVALVCAAGTVVLGIGIPLLLGGLAALRGFAGLHRRWAARVLGVSIARPYRPASKRGWLARLKATLRDPATWRDLAWLLLNGTAGLMLCLLSMALFALGLGVVGLSVAWPLLPPTAGNDIGFVWAADRVGTYLAAPPRLVPLVVGLVVVLVWWWASPPLMRANARLAASLLAPTERVRLAQRVEQLATSRAETVDAQAAELRRIERDLHDGAQARLVALGMSLGMADEVVETHPEAAKELLAEARQAGSQALAELRDLVRGIHPPVLADRGLDGAVRALALANPLPTDVEIDIPGRLRAPVESAAYFAVAETLTNVIKHSGASTAWVRLRHAEGELSVTVGDDGDGGADPSEGTGLRGVKRRLAAFDGTLTITSPHGGPTVVTMELPCELLSPRTSPSSETG
ncbi:MAG: sensor histidine kinase [Carbonactinosporaceae bacterium]